MSEDLRRTMLHSAASRYGAEHYRGILFLHHTRRLWPVVGVLLILAGAGWLLWPAIEAAGDHPNVTGALIVGAPIAVGLIALIIRRLRSPYRRRRF